MAAGEMSPLVRSGGLADAVAALSAELRRQGHEVGVVLPCYRAIREGKTKPRSTGIKFTVPVGAARLPCEILQLKSGGVPAYLVARDEYFDRSGLYGVDGRDYQDNAARFIFFTKCVVELARRLEPAPEVLHLNSWEAALAPVFVRDQRLPIATVLTPHALEYQGNFWSYDFALTNLPGEYFSARGLEYFGSMNCLKAGILFADAVVLPGERFVCEAQTPAAGCGLENVLCEQSHKVFGIPNDADLEAWNPARDAALPAAFSAEKPAGREKCRAALLEAAGLDAANARTIFAVPADSDPGLVLDALDRILALDNRVVFLGELPATVSGAWEAARRKHRGRVAHVNGGPACRLALAGSDLFLAPNAVDPRAVWLRRAMRYGAVPLALQCGGLFQLVCDWEPGGPQGNGFVFYARTVDGLVDATRRASRAMADPAQSAVLRDQAMRRNTSWEAAATAHAALYQRLRSPGARAA